MHKLNTVTIINNINCVLKHKPGGYHIYTKQMLITTVSL